MPRTKNPDVEVDASVRNRPRIRFEYVILAGLLCLFAFKFLQKTQEIRSMAAQQRSLQVMNERVAQDNDRLRANILQYRSPEYVQRQARVIFGFINAGDVPIMVQVKHGLNRPVPRTQPRAAFQVSPLRQWLHAFFG